jgi:hypothetical protein
MIKAVRKKLGKDGGVSFPSEPLLVPAPQCGAHPAGLFFMSRKNVFVFFFAEGRNARDLIYLCERKHRWNGNQNGNIWGRKRISKKKKKGKVAGRWC